MEENQVERVGSTRLLSLLEVRRSKRLNRVGRGRNQVGDGHKTSTTCAAGCATLQGNPKLEAAVPDTGRHSSRNTVRINSGGPFEGRLRVKVVVPRGYSLHGPPVDLQSNSYQKFSSS